MYETYRHLQCNHPASFLLEEPGQFVHAAVKVRVTSDGISAGRWQWLVPVDKVTGPVRTATSNLQYGKTKKLIQTVIASSLLGPTSSYRRSLLSYYSWRK